MDIFEAISNNDIEKVKELLDSGVDVNIQDKYAKTPLYFACLTNKIEIVKLLLQYPEIDVNIKNEYDDGWTPLYTACFYNFIDIVKLLLQYPEIDVNIKNLYKETPLYVACQYNHIRIVKLLLEHPDTDVNVKDRDGRTHLHWACINNKIEIVKLLLTKPKIEIDFDYNKFKYNPRIRSLLKSHIYKNSINKILSTIQD